MSNMILAFNKCQDLKVHIFKEYVRIKSMRNHHLVGQHHQLTSAHKSRVDEVIEQLWVQALWKNNLKLAFKCPFFFGNLSKWTMPSENASLDIQISSAGKTKRQSIKYFDIKVPQGSFFAEEEKSWIFLKWGCSRNTHLYIEECRHLGLIIPLYYPCNIPTQP